MDNLYNDLPFLLERMKIEEIEKLVANLDDKDEYHKKFVKSNTSGFVWKKLIGSLSLTLLARGEGGYVPQGYIFVKNSGMANDFKLELCDF